MPGRCNINYDNQSHQPSDLVYIMASFLQSHYNTADTIIKIHTSMPAWTPHSLQIKMSQTAEPPRA